MSDLSELQAAVSATTEAVSGFISHSKDLEQATAARLHHLEQKGARQVEGDFSSGAEPSVAGQVEGHDNFKSLKAGQTRKITIPINGPMLAKTTIVTSTTLARPDRLPGIYTPAARRLFIRNLLPQSTTQVGMIEYARENSFTNAAGPQVETFAKSESALAFSLQQSPVRTIAHWIPASKQVLDDSQQLRNHIDARLLYGLALIEEAQILAGDGTGQNLLGLITQAAAFTGSVTGDTKLDTVRRAILQIELTNNVTSGVVIHPTDWAECELLKDTIEDYVFGDPHDSQAPSLWGKPAVVTPAIAAGTFLVGDFIAAAEIFDRQNAVVEVSTEHESFFIRNLVAIRAEERIALVCYRPTAMCTGTFA